MFPHEVWEIVVAIVDPQFLIELGVIPKRHLDDTFELVFNTKVNERRPLHDITLVSVTSRLHDLIC